MNLVRSVTGDAGHCRGRSALRNLQNPDLRRRTPPVLFEACVEAGAFRGCSPETMVDLCIRVHGTREKPVVYFDWES